MSAEQLSSDDKGRASQAFGKLIGATRRNFPDQKFWPRAYLDTPIYHLAGIRTGDTQWYSTADGIGTKPELAERLYTSTGDAKYFEGLAFDTMAMIDGDTARFGYPLIAVTQIIDTNNARDEKVMQSLAKGAQDACREGGFALVNGETAELGYRVMGYGNTRINWNAQGNYLIIPEKKITGEGLKPGQKIVAFREDTIRTNGLTLARDILETSFLYSAGYSSKTEYVFDQMINNSPLKRKVKKVDYEEILQRQMDFMDKLGGHDFLETILLPWHETFPEITKELLKPSRLFGPLIHSAQGWTGPDRPVKIVAASHITGGGVPEKVKRMVEVKGLGAHIDHFEGYFPDPLGVKMLLELAGKLPEELSKSLIDDRKATKTWNRGIGFIAVVNSQEDVWTLQGLGQRHGVVVGPVGEITNKREIEYRGNTWRY